MSSRALSALVSALLGLLALITMAAATVVLGVTIGQAVDTIKKLGWSATSGEVVGALDREEWIRKDQPGFVVRHPEGEAFVVRAADITLDQLDTVGLNHDPSDGLAPGDAVTIYLEPGRPDFLVETGNLFTGPQPITNASFTAPWLIGLRAVLAAFLTFTLFRVGRSLWRAARSPAVSRQLPRVA